MMKEIFLYIFILYCYLMSFTFFGKLSNWELERSTGGDFPIHAPTLLHNFIMMSMIGFPILVLFLFISKRNKVKNDKKNKEEAIDYKNSLIEKDRKTLHNILEDKGTDFVVDMANQYKNFKENQ